MFGSYNGESIQDYTKEILKSYLEDEITPGEMIYTSDIAGEALNYANSYGYIFVYTNDAEDFLKDNYDKAEEAYEYAKFNMDYEINPLKDINETISFMFDQSLAELVDKSETLRSSDKIELSQRNIEKIFDELDIKHDIPEEFKGLGDTYWFIRDWQDSLEENGADAFEDCSPKCFPIIDESGEILGQDMRVSEVPAVWLDTVEEKWCVYTSGGNLAVFDADSYACEELSDIAKEAFEEEVAKKVEEYKASGEELDTHSTLEDIIEDIVRWHGKDTYLDEGRVVKIEIPEKSVEEVVEHAEENIQEPESADSKTKDDPER